MRENVLQADKLIEESVGIFISHAQANRSFFLFMAQGLSGESRAIQDGIRSEMRYFASELANDLRRLKLVDHLSDGDLEMTCDLVVRSVAFSSSLLERRTGITSAPENSGAQLRLARFCLPALFLAWAWAEESGFPDHPELLR